MKSTLSTWRKLIENNYFENHELYKKFHVSKPFFHEVEGMTIAEIGCGYGAQTVYFSKNAERVYGIDVSNVILKKAKRFIEKHGDIKKATLLLVDDYDRHIPDNNIDLAYSRHVFQHIAGEQVQEYVDTFFNKLRRGGLFCAQFRLGEKKSFPSDAEPKVCFQEDEILFFFDGYDIQMTMTEKTNFYIRAMKP